MQKIRPKLLLTLLVFSHTVSHAQQSHKTSNINVDFIDIPAGEFIMGTPDLTLAIADLPNPDAAVINDESPAHKVIFKKPFRLSRTEVTQKLWLQIMDTKPGPSSHWNRDDWQQLPVVSISWLATNRFINKLNQQSHTTQYRLPTEAEWEYAARAGSTGLRPFPRLALDEYAWYLHSSNDEIQPVATLEANDWGLYDMYGNAWEWVADWYHPNSYANSKTINPQGPQSGTKRIRRGGSYHCPPHLVRSAYRAADAPNTAYSVLGFRLVAEDK